MKKNKAFALLEILIVFAIVGILAGLAISSFQNIRANSCVKAYEKGEKLNKEQLEIVRKYYKANKNSNNSNASAEEHKTIVIDGKTYKLVPQ